MSRPYDPGGECIQNTGPDRRGKILSSLDMFFTGRLQIEYRANEGEDHVMSQVMKGQEKLIQKNEKEGFLLIDPWEKIKKIFLTDKMCREIVVPYWLWSSIVGGGANVGQCHRLSQTLWDPGGC